MTTIAVITITPSTSPPSLTSSPRSDRSESSLMVRSESSLLVRLPGLYSPGSLPRDWSTERSEADRGHITERIQIDYRQTTDRLQTDYR